nr:ribonuclease H-like domain-containing protein [Tanacetum cinerariifolium]
MKTRENAAATLFSLSLANEDKFIIGASGAIPALVYLLENESTRGKKDVATTLFNLCVYQGNKGRAMKAGVIVDLLKMLTDSSSCMVDDSLPILSARCSDPVDGTGKEWVKKGSTEGEIFFGASAKGSKSSTLDVKTKELKIASLEAIETLLTVVCFPFSSITDLEYNVCMHTLGSFRLWTLALRQMEIHLIASVKTVSLGLKSHVKEDTASTNPDWCQLDDLIKMWILGSLCDSLQEQVVTTPGNAKALWDHLKELFHDNKDARALNLDNELCCVVSDKNLVIYTVNRLDSRFATLVEIIRHRETLPTFETTRTMLLLKESSFTSDSGATTTFESSSLSPIILKTSTSLSTKGNTNKPSPISQIYNHFNRGTCKFEDRCKFIHDHRNRAGHLVTQTVGIIRPWLLLERAHMANCNPSRTPVNTESKLGPDGVSVQDHTLYRSLAGGERLQYLTFTRPDLSYAVQRVCLYMHDLREPPFATLKRILRYVQGTLELGLHLYAFATTSLVWYIDADWAGCPSTHMSTSGYCVFLGDNLLSWSGKQQHTISRSSVEAEYRGVANVVAETSWICNLLRELHSSLLTATLVNCDNVSAVYMSANPVQHQRTKHIEIDIHFVRDMVKSGHVRVLHVPSCFQYADIFIKEEEVKGLCLIFGVLAILGPVPGDLKMGLYSSSCPKAEKIVQDYVNQRIPIAFP